MQLDRLQELVTYWQDVLRLQEWRITVGFVLNLADEATGAPCYGMCWPLVANKTATIAIRDPSTPIGQWGDAEIEHAVIHELTHLHFAAFGTRTSPEVAAEEQAVWALSDALFASRGTEQEASIGRAMAAHVASMTRPVQSSNASRAVGAEGRMPATKKMIDPTERAAIKALLSTEDPQKNIGAFLKELDASDGAEPEPKAAEEPPPDSERREGQMAQAKPARAEEIKDEPKAQRATTSVLTELDVKRIAGESTVAAIREHTQRAAVIASNLGRMSKSMAAYLETLPLQQVRDLVATLDPAPIAGKAQEVPAQAVPGASGVSGVTDLQGRVNKLMGITRDPVQSVTRNELTGRLEISNLGTFKFEEPK